MEQSQPSSRRLLLLGLAAVVGLILVIAVVAFVLFGSTKKEDNANNANSGKQVATQEEVQQDLKELNASIQQAVKDHAAAKAAIKDSEKQVKVAN
jgi:type II secretory pathway component PulM